MHWCGLMERKMRHRFKNIFCQPMSKMKHFMKKLIGIEKKIMMAGNLEVIGNISSTKQIHLN